MAKKTTILFFLFAYFIPGCFSQGKTNSKNKIPLHFVSDGQALPAKNIAKKFTIYFTIDDGPLEGSPFIDSVFRNEKEPADLFLVGMHANIGKQFKDYFTLLHTNRWL